MKILIKRSSYGFEAGKQYSATRQASGYFAKNGTLSKFISGDDAEVVE